MTNATIRDDVFEALADGRRRELLCALLTDESVPVPALTEPSREMAGADEGILTEYLDGTREVAGADKELVRLYHVHLPKLDGGGFVAWDREAGVVARGPRFDELRPFLGLLDEPRDAAPVARYPTATQQ